VKVAALIVLQQVVKSLFYSVMTAPTSVLYVHALKQEVHNLVQTFMLYVPKYVEPVQWKSWYCYNFFFALVMIRS
jgi:hypothetical protein